MSKQISGYKHICIYPSLEGKTLIMDFEVDENGVVQIRRRAGRHMSIKNITEVMRGTSPHTPIFVDTTYPEVIDELRRYGHWVVR